MRLRFIIEATCPDIEAKLREFIDSLKEAQADLVNDLRESNGLDVTRMALEREVPADAGRSKIWQLEAAWHKDG